VAPPVKFYADEHIAKAVVRGMRARGVDIISAVEANMLGATDEQHLELATNNNRVVVTQDDDFIGLHAAGFDHAGIVYAKQGRSIGDIVSGLMLVYQVLDADDMRGQLEYL
jgi:hypothetical protein